MSKLAKLGAPVALCLAFLAVASSPALAASPLKIREVFPGSTTTDPKAEYVELQMTETGQNDIDGQVVQFWDKDGNLTSTYTIPADVANGQSQRTVLLATQEAVEHFPGLPTPDFNIGSGANRMDPSGGGVCLTGGSSADCVTWGSVPIFDLFSGFPDPQAANAIEITDELALHRKISGGCATYLDAADDTANSATDFAQVTPGPRNNVATPTETRCAPDTALNTFPANPINQTSASFTYGAVPTEPGVSFECKLDAASFASCPNAGKSYPGPLADGSHTFQVKAIGEGGPDPSPKTYTWTVDTVAPNTTITSVPADKPTDGFLVTFGYQSTEASSSFKCQLDSEAIQVCSGSSKTYFLLNDGPHTVRVWATDQAGNQDPTPAEYAFTVKNIDRTPPDTTIVSSPANPSQSDTNNFTYASTEQGSSFRCSLNGSPFESCPASGTTYSRLRNGSYIFSVKATDAAGNTDSVPASYSWTVAAPLPRVTITKAPPGNKKIKSKTITFTFRFKADKPNSSFYCHLDKQSFKPCSSPLKVKARIGRHRFEVYAVDDLGNEGTAKARRIFRVQKRKKQGGLF